MNLHLCEWNNLRRQGNNNLKFDSHIQTFSEKLIYSSFPTLNLTWSIYSILEKKIFKDFEKSLSSPQDVKVNHFLREISSTTLLTMPHFFSLNYPSMITFSSSISTQFSTNPKWLSSLLHSFLIKCCSSSSHPF